MHCNQVIFQNILQLVILKKTGLKRNAKLGSVDFNSFDTSNVLEFHKFLMKGKQYKTCLKLLKKCLLYYLVTQLMGLIVRIIKQ